MKYTQEQQNRFLQDEYDAEVDVFKRKLNTVATTLLLQEEEMFVGQLAGMKNGQMLMLFSNKRALPRIGDHFYCMLLPKNLRAYKTWGLLSYKNLIQRRQLSTDCVCIWHSRSDSERFSLVGFRGIDIDFAKAMETAEQVILAFGPAVPPYEYLTNLMKVISLQDHLSTQILQTDYIQQETEPIVIDNRDNVTDKILELNEKNDTIIIQGPPGTGKTTLLSRLCAKLLSEDKSILVTSLTNRALMELAEKKDIEEHVNSGKVYKTNITSDEENELPHLNSIKDIEPIKGSLVLSTFYMTSGTASQMAIPSFDYVIVDEASQAFLAMLAATNNLGNKRIWVGDINQLPPITQINSDFIDRHNYQRLVDGLRTVTENNNVPVYQLNYTFRFPQRAADYTACFYNGMLKSAKQSFQLPLQGKLREIISDNGGPTLIKTDFNKGDDSPRNGLNIILDLINSIYKENPKAKIAVLSCKRTTVRALQKAVNINIGRRKDLIVDTVARIQGLTTEYTIYFIPNTIYIHSLEKRLFNVATSRSEIATIILSDKDVLSYKNMHKDVRKYLEKLDKDKSFYISDSLGKYFCTNHDEINSENEFSKMSDNELATSDNDDHLKELKAIYPGLENIVEQLYDAGIPFDEEGNIDLTDNDGDVIASASMLFKDKKIAIDPLDKESEIEFNKRGYRVINSTDFNIDMLKE